eukprot:357281-Chlamydomonas_euryale.AAC.6
MNQEVYRVRVGQPCEATCTWCDTLPMALAQDPLSDHDFPGSPKPDVPSLGLPALRKGPALRGLAEVDNPLTGARVHAAGARLVRVYAGTSRSSMPTSACVAAPCGYNSSEVLMLESVILLSSASDCTLHVLPTLRAADKPKPRGLAAGQAPVPVNKSESGLNFQGQADPNLTLPYVK